ncbi:MAG: hypothetical protein HC898_10600 [Phycisphaerales bacterium]|nr:hypothetical protein [Phycisphaerales bacterium]
MFFDDGGSSVTSHLRQIATLGDQSGCELAECQLHFRGGGIRTFDGLTQIAGKHAFDRFHAIDGQTCLIGVALTHGDQISIHSRNRGGWADLIAEHG